MIDEIFRLLLDVWMLQFFLVSGQVLEISDLLLFRFDHIEKKLDYVQIILGYPSQNADVVYVTDVCESDDGQTMCFSPRVAALCGRDEPSTPTLTSCNGGRETLRRGCPSLST